VRVMDRDNGVRLSRRRVLAFGAASVAVMALAACGGSTATPLPTPKPANTVASTAPTAAASNPSDVASRNNKYKSPPPITIDKSKKYIATIVTNKGTMKAELYADTAPVTVNNFVFLANDHFYDGVIFHRIFAGFVIQGGDPTGTGAGGPGYQFADEPIPANRTYDKGVLAMANSGPNTNGSQFFVCLDQAKGQLQKIYNIFGKIIEGLDVVDKIAATPTKVDQRGEKSVPTEKVFMETVRITVS